MLAPDASTGGCERAAAGAVAGAAAAGALVRALQLRYPTAQLQRHIHRRTRALLPGVSQSKRLQKAVAVQPMWDVRKYTSVVFSHGSGP